MNRHTRAVSFIGSASLLVALLVGGNPVSFAAEAGAIGSEVQPSATDQPGDVGNRAVPGGPASRQSLPLQLQPQGMPMPGMPQTWDVLWDVTWKRAAFYYQIQAAPATLQDPTCQGNLGFDVLVKNTIQAVSLKKYGDATRFMGQFQDRSLCLTRQGARGLEFALAMYVHRAVTLLPPQQAQLAVMGVMNLGLQTFDQLQYTGQSWWLPMVNIDYGRIQPLMAGYPRGELGLWMYDFRRGMMVQSGLQDGIDRVLWSMQRLDNFGRGTCMLLDMSATDFICQDFAGAGGGGKSGSAGMMAPPGGIPASGVACVLDSVKSSGVRGQFACMSRAIAGMTPDPRTAGADLAKQASQQPGIRDKFCALSEEAGGTTATDQDTKKKEPGLLDKIGDAAGKVKDVVVSVLLAVFDKTPPVVDVAAQAASPEGADAARGVLQSLQAGAATKNLGDTGDPEDFYKAREGRVTTDPQANKGRTINDPMNPSGGCGSNGSNAAARAKSLYQCTMGSDMTPRQPSGGMGGVRNPGSPSPIPNPTIALFDPSQAAGPIPGAISCMMESGDLARNGPNDQKCAAMHCMQGETCPCNRTSGMSGGQPMELKSQLKAGPECIDGPCASAPGQSGGIITGPKTGGGGTGPVPLGGTPPKGPTPIPPGGGGGPIPTR
jgi:hypothetical protein